MLLTLCPTRGRPQAAREAWESHRDTATLADTEILFVVDEDDDRLQDYLDAGIPVLVQPSPGNMVAALNRAAEWALQRKQPKYIGFIGDDHRFRTLAWDMAFTKALDSRGGGFIYGHDMFWQDGAIPTQIWMSATIVGALGWMGLPTCRHLYIDNAWKALGEETESLYWMPDFIIEHMHPAAGKAQWDEGHKRVNSEEMYGHDQQAFQDWFETRMQRDVALVRGVLDG